MGRLIDADELLKAIEYFKFHRKIFCEDHLKICPKDSIAYQATLKEKEFYDMAIKALEQEPKTGHWKPYLKEGLRYQCSACDSRFDTPWEYCPHCGAKMAETEAQE